MTDRIEALKSLATQIVERAQSAGAGVAEVLVREGAELNVKVRKGEPEMVEEAAPKGIGLRVIVDGRAGTMRTSDLTEAGLSALVDGAIEVAQLSEPDEFNAPPDPALLATEVPDLELYDESGGDLDAHAALARAKEAEAAGEAYDDRITNSEGASFSRTLGTSVLATSGGFCQGYRGSSYSLVANPIAAEGDDKMQTGYYWDARRYIDELEPAAQIGEEAARRTLAKLGAGKVDSCQAPVIFDPDAGRALLSALFGCLSGHSIYRRTSYLIDKEGEAIASDLVTIVDDPLIPRAPGSRPFDGEGLPSRKNVVVQQGKLQTFLLDTYSAKKLGKESTGNASRGIGGTPGVGASNFRLLPGDRNPDDIVAEVDRGLFVTSMMGFGFNAVTGDFSRGAEGFWIENGKKVRPVGEITISLNFDDLWKSIDAIGNDLQTKSSVGTPTFRVKKMTIAGS